MPAVGSKSGPRLQWGRGLSPAETRRCRPSQVRWCTLQWGRGLSPAETADFDADFARMFRASMGPRAFTRGNEASTMACCGVRSASMGPRAFTRGNAGRSNGSKSGSAASMGPRAFTRGNVSGSPHRVHLGGSLQWGRGLSPAETTPSPMRATAACAASMGPRAFTRGNLPGVFLSISFNVVLQWGRGLSPAETSTRWHHLRGWRQLQWGRGLSPAET